MTTLQDIERAVSLLRPEQLSEFREWFARYDAEKWDREIEQDVLSGKLDALAHAAIHDLKNGNCKEL